MCDLFQANPWKPLLCTNCHQNRSGHQIIDINENKCEHIMSDKSKELPSSSSSMHLYEEIMAQYFTINTTDVNTLQSTSVIECLPTSNENNNNNNIDDIDDDSFSDEEQDLIKQTVPIEFIQNQSMINTQGIVLIGPDLRTKQITTKKQKKINLLKKSKSNADECLKKTDITDNNNNNTSKLWWFKVKKTNSSSIVQNESTTDSNKPNVYLIV
ncbi:unnamed protein product [Rotaria sp. Silwood2]|nr:unnamed protein product [Rotaria sp. Silwood2]